MPVDAADSLQRAVRRRNDALAALAALSPSVLARPWQTANPHVVLEVYAQLAEACGIAKMAATAVGVRPVPLPSSLVSSGNGTGGRGG